jgi:hypothetical protein
VKPQKVKLTIPRVPKSPNSLLQRHWRVVQNDKNDWKLQVFAFYRGGYIRSLCTEDSKHRVTIAVHSPYREMDPDNLQASRKPILDALVYNGLIYDDAREWCESTITQHKSSKKEMRTEILIEGS